MNDLYPWQYMYAQEHARCKKLEAELDAAKREIEKNAVFMAVHGVNGYSMPPHNYIGEEAVAGPEEVQDESN